MLLRAVAFTHRWLGIGGCLLFLAWFASGIVMIYARMPRLAPDERLAGMAPFDAARVRLTPAEIADRYAIAAVRLEAQTIAGRPAYSFTGRGRSITTFADDGERFRGLTREQALAEAARFAPEQRTALRYDAHIAEPDQWTLESRALLPMHRIALGDAAGSVVYVSDVSGQVALKTTGRERRVAYAGAVLHWLYFTPLRKHGPLWTQSIIWLSLAGSVMCLLGLVWGFYVGLRTPYRGWLRWHHYAGLAFGAVSFTWVFSGLLSMDPWDWHPGTVPSLEQRAWFAGGEVLPLDRVSIASLADAQSWSADEGRTLKAIEIGYFAGEPIYSLDGGAGGVISTARITTDALVAAARAAMRGAPLEETSWLSDYDSYYYDRELPLPVLRVRFVDAARTWLYIDPRRGTILRREERRTRLNRWLYRGLHSLDFPWLHSRRPLWDIVVIVLSLGGMASAVTSVVPAWRRLCRHARHLGLGR